MTLSDRDRRILLILVPIVVVIAYWFLVLSPKRDDLSKAHDAQHAAETARDAAVAQASQLQQARATFAADYAEVVKLGKAIPETVDSPSLLIQLNKAANGTHIDFNSVSFGARVAGGATVPTSTTSTGTQGPAQPAGNAAAGGAPAATGLGGAAESAGNAVNAGNAASTAAGGTTTTTTTTGTTGPAGTTGAPATTAGSLDTVSLTFNFTGSYFDLADFFHRLKRFVYVVNDRIIVLGRLMTIDTLAFAPGAAGATSSTGATNQLTATVGATVYLSPQTQGVTGGATAAGPAGTTTTPTTPSGAQTSSVPLATVSAR